MGDTTNQGPLGQISGMADDWDEDFSPQELRERAAKAMREQQLGGKPGAGPVKRDPAATPAAQGAAFRKALRVRPSS